MAKFKGVDFGSWGDDSMIFSAFCGDPDANSVTQESLGSFPAPRTCLSVHVGDCAIGGATNVGDCANGGPTQSVHVVFGAVALFQKYTGFTNRRQIK